LERAAKPRATPGVEKRRPLSRGDNPLVRAVGRLPAKVHTKLLIAFVGTAVLVVGVGVLGLRVLGQSNDRVGTLGTLQERSFAYGKLRSDTAQIRSLLAENVDPAFYKVWPGAFPTDRGTTAVAVDLYVLNALTRIGPSTRPDRLGFVPPAEDEKDLREIRITSDRLSTVVDRMIEREIRIASDRLSIAVERIIEREIPITSDRLSTLVETIVGSDLDADVGDLRNRAERLAVNLNLLATELANATTAMTDDLIAQNARAYASSRNLFIGVAVGALVLALLLGFVLSWSLIGPIQRIDSRLAAIASGDFSKHVDVTNRDELGALGTNVDRMNDELRRLYGELETTSQHKSEFLASMSHELRTPLNAILGFSQVLREGMVGEVNEKQAEYLDDIISSGNHLLSLINDVLDLSKVEAGQVEIEIAPFSLRETLERGVLMVKERATDNGVGLSLEADPRVELVEADERRTHQVIVNLLSNAVKFTPEGGSINVSSARVNGEVHVSVEDTGPGIAPEDQVRIFEEFQQTELGAKARDGTGLGLALSKRFIELQGGRIWVESEPGKGSRFTFAIPAKVS
jgi:signal transduction histidine kinase